MRASGSRPLGSASGAASPRRRRRRREALRSRSSGTVSHTKRSATKTRGRAGVVAGIEAQLDLAADQLGADLQEAAAEADGAVLAHDPALAVQEDLVEVGGARQRAQERHLGEPVLARRPAGGGVRAGVVLESPHTRPRARSGGAWSTRGIPSSARTS